MMEANIRTDLISTCFPPRYMLWSSGLDLGKSFNCGAVGMSYKSIHFSACTVQQSWWYWMMTHGGNRLFLSRS